MDQSKATTLFLIHKNIAFIVLIAIGLVVQNYPPHGWSESTVIIFFLVTQVSFYLGILTNLRFNGYGVRERVNQMARAPVIPDFGLTWRGYAVKPLVRSWTFSFMANTAIMAVMGYFLLFEKEGLVSLGAPVLIAYASAKILALAGEIYVWMMADRHRHWYLAEGRLREYLRGLQRPPKAIDAIIDRARQAELLITRVKTF
ncbi:hypothetical protein KGM48_03905 [Patescibacteria group bacterium]|nr:hypothetical protein [Patescibacteria group bacterium]